MLNGNILLTC